MVVQANGFRGSAVPCFTADNDTFMFFGETVDQKTLKASGKNLVVLGVPAEISAAGAARVATEDGIHRGGSEGRHPLEQRARRSRPAAAGSSAR